MEEWAGSKPAETKTPRRFGPRRPLCESFVMTAEPSDSIPIAVITGASAGVGRAAAAQLLAMGWRVIGTGRDPARCAEAAADLASDRFTLLTGDFALLADVARVAAEIAGLAPRIDVLCNNAGGVQATRRVSAEGHEATFAANHLAPFLLTRLLLPRLAPGARVIATSSDGHAHSPGIQWDDPGLAEGWQSGRAYCQAKLANVLFTRELARRHGDAGLIAHALHPGTVASNFASHCEPGMKAYMESIMDRAISPDTAARALVRLATDPALGTINGRYFEGLDETPPAPAGQDDAAAARLWALSETLVAPYLPAASATMRNSS